MHQVLHLYYTVNINLVQFSLDVIILEIGLLFQFNNFNNVKTETEKEHIKDFSHHVSLDKQPLYFCRKPSAFFAGGFATSTCQMSYCGDVLQAQCRELAGQYTTSLAIYRNDPEMSKVYNGYFLYYGT